MLDKIHISYLNSTSINKVNTDLANYLTKKGYEVTHSQIPRNGKILIQHFFNTHVVQRAGKRFEKTILIQPIDGTVLNDSVSAQMNMYDLIITPSNSCKEILKNNGVIKDIIVIPNYYDDSIVNSDNGHYSNNYRSHKYTFYSESTGIKRKNVANILKHFISEFDNTIDVRLIIKITNKDTGVISELEGILSDAMEKYSGVPEVIIINEFMQERDLNSMRRGIDCYICLSYMEGFCIPLLSAVILKKDIICLDTQISGYSDYINKDNAVLLSVKRMPTDKTKENSMFYSAESEWEEPSYEEYKIALRNVFEGAYCFNKEAYKYDEYSESSVMSKYMHIIRRISLGEI